MAVALFDYDAELVRHHERLREALDIRRDDRVLDIGCGTGLSTRDAARAASRGSALGVDVSGPMLERARRLAEEEGLDNVAFVQGDAQVHGFPPGHFTVAISRFGTMFFADPIAAFANIRQALCPGGLFVQLVWQGRERQEWDAAIRSAFSPDPRTPSATSPGPADAAFSLAEPDAARAVLTGAGFTTVDVVDVREPVRYGPDADHALDAALQLQVTRELLADLDAASADRARDRLRATLKAHDTGDGVWLDSRAWLITARAGK